MRILTLIHEYPPIGGGGGRIAQDIVRGLVALGHEVVLIAPHMKGLKRLELDEGVRLVRIRSFRRKAFVGDLMAMSGYIVIGFIVGLWNILYFRPDVIHVHFAVPAGFLARVLSKLTGIPYVLTCHLGDVPGGVPEKTDRWFRWIYPFTHCIWQDAAAVTAISRFTHDLALSHYPVEIRDIPNAIKINREVGAEIQVNAPPCIVFAGRFVNQKNPHLIPQVLHGLRDLEWNCVMMGDGELMREVAREIESLGLNGRFSLTGWKSPADVADVLMRSDILFLPSKTEGIPLIGLQSLVNGVAIVASNVGGVPELVRHGVNGFLHHPLDVDGFQASLRSFLTDKGKLHQARLASLQHARQFDIERILKSYEETLLAASKTRR